MVGEELAPKHSTLERRPCNRHQCGCSHLKCRYKSNSAGGKSIRTEHFGQLEQWGTQHKCKMHGDDDCRCICGDPTINQDWHDIVKGKTSVAVKGKLTVEWTKHVHLEFLEKKHKHNKYFDYLDNAVCKVNRIKCVGKCNKYSAGSRDRKNCNAKCITCKLDAIGDSRYKGLTATGRALYNKDISRAPYCGGGKLEDEPAKKNCVEGVGTDQQYKGTYTSFPTNYPTSQPTAIGHDGWEGLNPTAFPTSYPTPTSEYVRKTSYPTTYPTSYPTTYPTARPTYKEIQCVGHYVISSCSHICGSKGTKSKTYHVTQRARHGGAACPQLDGFVQALPCNRKVKCDPTKIYTP